MPYNVPSRIIRLTPELAQKIESMLEQGCSQAHVWRSLGISNRTVRKVREAYRERVAKAQANAALGPNKVAAK